MYKAILIPDSTKESLLIKLRDEVLYNDTDASDLWIPQHLIIVSDEEIKEGDLVLEPTTNTVRRFDAGAKLPKMIAHSSSEHKLPGITTESINQWINAGCPKEIELEEEQIDPNAWLCGCDKYNEPRALVCTFCGGDREETEKYKNTNSTKISVFTLINNQVIITIPEKALYNKDNIVQNEINKISKPITTEPDECADYKVHRDVTNLCKKCKDARLGYCWKENGGINAYGGGFSEEDLSKPITTEPDAEQLARDYVRSQSDESSLSYDIDGFETDCFKAGWAAKEQQLKERVENLRSQSFIGWTKQEINGYSTALSSILKKDIIIANSNNFSLEDIIGFASYVKEKLVSGRYGNSYEQWLKLYLKK